VLTIQSLQGIRSQEDSLYIRTLTEKSDLRRFVELRRGEEEDDVSDSLRALGVQNCKGIKLGCS